MKVEILKDFEGYPDGINLKKYKAGDIVEIPNAATAKDFIKAGYCKSTESEAPDDEGNAEAASNDDDNQSDSDPAADGIEPMTVGEFFEAYKEQAAFEDLNAAKKYLKDDFQYEGNKADQIPVSILSQVKLELTKADEDNDNGSVSETEQN